MYQHLKKMLEIAEEVGAVNSLNMGEWLRGKDHISIRGETTNGQPFELELFIGESKEVAE